MKEIIITQELHHIRVDKVCHKVFCDVPTSFIYKMFRKKNICLNGKKIAGHELLEIGDTLTFYFSEESFEKLSRPKDDLGQESTHKNTLNPDLILYEDENVLVYNKPVGILSQPNGKDISLVELFENTQLQKKQITLHPSIHIESYGVCNRLDRNTTGVTFIGKNPSVLKKLNESIKERQVKKQYHAIVAGFISGPLYLESYLVKDATTNKVTLYSEEIENSDFIKTDIEPMGYHEGLNITLLNIALHTGKTHQIRAHLASIGHPILGDDKYGDNKINRYFRERYKIEYQLLHSYSYTFLSLTDQLGYLQERDFIAPYFEPMEGLIKLIRQTR